MRLKATVFVLMSVSTLAYGQPPTLRDIVAQTHRPITSMVGSPMWTDATSSLDQLLVGVDLVVRGVLGTSVAYLSENGRDIHTDYVIALPQIISPAAAATVDRPGLSPGPITITQLGGTMTLEGQRVTVLHRGLPPLKTGMDGIFLLTRKGGKYCIAGDYLGAFAINGGTIVPLTRNGVFAAPHRGKTVAQFIPEVIAKLQAVRR